MELLLGAASSAWVVAVLVLDMVWPQSRKRPRWVAVMQGGFWPAWVAAIAATVWRAAEVGLHPGGGVLLPWIAAAAWVVVAAARMWNRRLQAVVARRQEQTAQLSGAQGPELRRGHGGARVDEHR